MDLFNNTDHTAEIIFVDPKAVRVSKFNPRHDVRHEGPAFDALKTSIESSDQIEDALGVRDKERNIVLLSGSRRRQVCEQLGRPLRVKLLTSNPDGRVSFRLAQEDETRSDVSIFDRGRSIQRALAAKLYKNADEVAADTGRDPSTVSRALAFANAPAPFLALFDPRTVSATQWYAFCPCLTDQTKRAKIMERVAALEGAPPLSATKVLGELAGIAEGRTADGEPVFIKNERGKTVGKVSASGAGAITIKLQPMRGVARRTRKQRLDEAVASALALLDSDERQRAAQIPAAASPNADAAESGVEATTAT